MKTSRKASRNQRQLLEKKVQPWLPLRTDPVPPTGWLKAIRGALGINTRQLAARLGVEHSAILNFEKREAEGTVSLESLRKVAKAMRCRVIYAVVPEEPFGNLESILDAQAQDAARSIISRADHTMRLEQQSITAESSRNQVKELAEKLKADASPSLWGDVRTGTQRKKLK